MSESAVDREADTEQVSPHIICAVLHALLVSVVLSEVVSAAQRQWGSWAGGKETAGSTEGGAEEETGAAGEGSSEREAGAEEGAAGAGTSYLLPK